MLRGSSAVSLVNIGRPFMLIAERRIAMAQSFSADELLALNRHVSDIKSDLQKIAQLLSTRLGAGDNLSQEAASALDLIDSLNNGLLRQSAKSAGSSVAGESAA